MATRGALLYFVIADLAAVDPMYQYSLDYFKRLFQRIVAQTPSHEAFDEHLQALLDRITEEVCRRDHPSGVGMWGRTPRPGALGSLRCPFQRAALPHSVRGLTAVVGRVGYGRDPQAGPHP